MNLTKFFLVLSLCGRTALGPTKKKRPNPILIIILFLCLVATCYMLPVKFGLGEIFKWEPSSNETQNLENQKWTVMKDKDGKSRVVLLEQPESFEFLLQNVKYKKEEEVKFYLYRREHKDVGNPMQTGDFATLKILNWVPEKPVKILVHGYIADYTAEAMQVMKEHILGSMDANVILVDWHSQASHYYYPTSAKACRDVGVAVADFIKFMAESEVPLKNIHLVGHSLGAHVCGFAGFYAQQIIGRVGRISGLDPALPSFQQTGCNDRLDKSDADFVDCIHTCAGLWGFNDPICSADFYPNGGKNQPGCHWYDMGGCSHSRAHELFTESIISSHQFPAFTCPDMADKSPVDCKNEGALMGFPANEKFQGIFYSQTNSVYPYSPLFL